MTLQKHTAGLDFGGAATYRIVVKGAISEDWSNRLGGLVITTSSQDNGDSQTILRGTLLDQSALRGLLETLYALHLPILEVRQIGDPEKSSW